MLKIAIRFFTMKTIGYFYNIKNKNMKHLQTFEMFEQKKALNEKVPGLNDYMNYSFPFKKSLENNSKPGRSFSIGNVKVKDANSNDATGEGYGELSAILQVHPIPFNIEYSVKMEKSSDENADVTIDIEVSTPEMRTPDKNTYTFKKLDLTAMDKTISVCVGQSLDKFMQKI